MTNIFKQCELSRPGDGGVQVMISWIPASVAIPGRLVRLNDSETGIWTSGWTVQSVGEPGLDGKVLLARCRDHLRTRDASDI